MMMVIHGDDDGDDDHHHDDEGMNENLQGGAATAKGVNGSVLLGWQKLGVGKHRELRGRASHAAASIIIIRPHHHEPLHRATALSCRTAKQALLPHSHASAQRARSRRSFVYCTLFKWRDLIGIKIKSQYELSKFASRKRGQQG